MSWVKDTEREKQIFQMEIHTKDLMKITKEMEWEPIGKLKLFIIVQLIVKKTIFVCTVHLQNMVVAIVSKSRFP